MDKLVSVNYWYGEPVSVLLTISTVGLASYYANERPYFVAKDDDGNTVAIKSDQIVSIEEV